MLDLRSVVSQDSVDILYVAPLRMVDIGETAEVCRAGKVLSLTGVPKYCSSKTIVGRGEKGGKPEIIINLPIAEEAGVDFRSLLLRLAGIVK